MNPLLMGFCKANLDKMEKSACKNNNDIMRYTWAELCDFGYAFEYYTNKSGQTYMRTSSTTAKHSTLLKPYKDGKVSFSLPTGTEKLIIWKLTGGLESSPGRTYSSLPQHFWSSMNQAILISKAALMKETKDNGSSKGGYEKALVKMEGLWSNSTDYHVGLYVYNDYTD